MKKVFFLLFLSFAIVSCKKESFDKTSTSSGENLITYAKGLQIKKYDEVYVMQVIAPWPEAKESFTYVLAKSPNLVPDSLQKIPFIQIPIQRIIPTSTTHISSIVSLQEEKTVVGFPHLEYISSEKIRSQIELGKIVELAEKESVNFELTLDLSPDLIVAHSIQGNNPKYDQLQKAGIPLMYNGDWMEQNPLGKAEWIKFFGVLYDKYDKAASDFENVVKEYEKTKALVSEIKQLPTVMSGAIYMDVWYAPQGDSWMAQFIKDAKGKYIWADSQGAGSLSLSFEEVFEKASEADVWIGPGQFSTYKELDLGNRHYQKFKPFLDRKIFSYSTKKGPMGGIVFYEDAPNRPDLILKDLVYILHPEVLKNYQPTFIEALQ